MDLPPMSGGKIEKAIDQEEVCPHADQRVIPFNRSEYALSAPL